MRAAVDQVESKHDWPQDEKAVRVDPHDLEERQGPGQYRTTFDAHENREEACEVDERENLGPRIEPRAQEHKSGQPKDR